MSKNILITALGIIILGSLGYLVVKNNIESFKIAAEAQKAAQVAASTISQNILFSVTSPDHSLEAVTYLTNTNKKTGPNDINAQDFSAGKYGDTVAIRNLKTGELTPVWQDSKDEYLRLYDMRFSPDGTKLFFTSNAVFVYDIASHSVQKIYQAEAANAGCHWLGIASISPDNGSLIINAGCYEGSESFVVSTTGTGVPWNIGTYGYDSAETVAAGYVKAGYILTLKYGVDTALNPISTELDVYSADGKFIKKITTIPKAVSVDTFDYDSGQGADFQKQHVVVTLRGYDGGVLADSTYSSIQFNRDTFEYEKK